ncbi:MAG: DUF2283 domain-containing protein [Thaumarchaeota archaeon]|nr:DUF2283 domain-containing protein [Nitrososphaerota archaeon]
MVSGKVTVTFDTEANAMYYKLGKGKVARTEKKRTDSLEYLLDYNNQGNLIGVEILNMKKALELTAGQMSLFFIPEARTLTVSAK